MSETHDYRPTLGLKNEPRKFLDLAALWALWRTRTQEAEERAKEHGLYEGGQHSTLKTGNSLTLKLIEDEQL